jgi:enterochelin esterase-like enzyme
MVSTAAPPSPAIDPAGVTFVLADPRPGLRTVRLVQEIGLPGPLPLASAHGQWRLRLRLPEVDRMEYLYEVEDGDGRRSSITDPGNPRRAGGVFGDKSEVRFPRYREPPWLAGTEVDHGEISLEGMDRSSAGDLAGTLWYPRTLPAGQPAPLVVVHDGPEYAARGMFTRYLGVEVAAGRLPPLRAALLEPGDRNRRYAANRSYALALRGTLLGTVASVAPATVRIGVGVSLGGLAMLHAHRCCPGLFDGLLLQSSSFFTPQLDPQERHFSGFAPVTSFVVDLHAAAADDRPVPTVLTCGIAEENLANNQRMAASLVRLGYPARMVEVRDAHNYTAWRDALHPHFTSLVTEVVANHAG